MNAGYENGKIVVKGRAFEEVPFDMGSEKCSVVADGKGGLCAYRVNNRAENFVDPFLSLTLFEGGKPIPVLSPKTVTMIGRKQEIEFEIGEKRIIVTVFLGKGVNGAFFSLRSSADVSFVLDLRAAKEIPSARASFFKGKECLLSSNAPVERVEEDECFYGEVRGETRLLLTFGGEEKAHREAFAAFDEALSETEREIASVLPPASAESEEEKAFYRLSAFAALENYKRSGDFAAFAAGSNYVYPLRTYFRDSYFTVLSVYERAPALIRREILTLANGVAEDGTCPSAVKSDGSAFWGGHFDSPSLFVLQVFDYVSRAKDESVLFEKTEGGNVLSEVDRVLKKLSESADETGLLYKEGRDRRDWADEVNRGGYVTYVEALYARALQAASELFKGRDDALSAFYERKYRIVKKAINDLLYDEEAGYFVNFKTRDFTERNLSIDTVFTVLFGIADEARSRSVLEKMERLLETENNRVSDEPFGAMCVYPPYEKAGEGVHKSARPFDYHNGANWPFLTALYAYAKHLFGMEFKDVLLSPLRFNVSRGRYTAIEYFSPYCKAGSGLQAWSSAAAFVYDNIGKENFFKIKGE